MTDQPMQEEIMYMPMPGQQPGMQPPRIDRADFIDRIKPDQNIEKIKYLLMGYDLVDDKWEKNVALQRYALSEYGANRISNLMLGASSTINVSISKLNADQISKRLQNFVRGYLRVINIEWKAMGIFSPAQIQYVHEIMFSNALVVYNQAGDGSIQELFKTTISEQRNISSERKEPGRLKKLFGMGE